MNVNSLALRLNILHMENTKKYCYLPYPNHPYGCPNCYGKCWGRGNDQVKIGSLMDLKKPYFLIYNEFNLEAHARRMKYSHPGWSYSQCKCVLYWQGTARKRLKARVEMSLWEITPKPNFVTYIPELYGVNLYKTCEEFGLILDKINEMKICRHIALLGYRTENKEQE